MTYPECDLSKIYKNQGYNAEKYRKTSDLASLSHTFSLLKVSVTVRGGGMFMRLFEKSYKVYMYKSTYQ